MTHKITKVLILIVLLTLICVNASATEITASGICGETMSWTMDSEGVLIVSGSGLMFDSFCSHSDWYNARENVTRIILEEGIQSIGQYAFSGCTNLQEISFPSTLTEVGYCAFDMYTDNSIKVYVPDLYTWFNIEFNNLFATPFFSSFTTSLYVDDQQIQYEILIPEGVTRIGYNTAFLHGIRRVIVPESVTYLGAAFDSCMDLMEVVFLGDAPEINNVAFQGVHITAYYPKANPTWTSEIMKNYQGDITWKAYDPIDTFGIIAEPESCSARINTNTSFHVLAVGKGLTYQWQRKSSDATNWEDIPSFIYDPATISVTVTDDVIGSSYRCVITNQDGDCIISREAVLSLDNSVCYDYSVDRVNDTLQYLNDIYIEKYPQLGLHFLYGDSREQNELQILADVITEGCSTDAEKAQAIADWISRNVEYESGYPSYPNNAFSDRKGNCTGYAILMQTLFRLEGIPAVWGSGWRGNLKEITPEALFNTVGHAWCWAYINGQWTLYDPLWLDEGTTDTAYMASWIYMDNIETIYPVYGDDFPPMHPASRSILCYNGDKFMVYTNGTPDESGMGVSTSVNYTLHYHSSTRYCADGGYNDGTNFLDSSKDRNELVSGELYRDAWLVEGCYKYAYENGIHAVGTVLNLNGNDYYMNALTGSAYKILASADDYFFVDSYFSVLTGYEGKPLETSMYDFLKYPVYSPEAYSITWSSGDTDIISVTEDGHITALREGAAHVGIKVIRKSDQALMSLDGFDIRVYDENPEPDYSDAYPVEHAHTYTTIQRESTCDNMGYVLQTCTFEKCAHSLIETYVDALSHEYGQWEPEAEASCTGFGEERRYCIHCDKYESRQIDATGHIWDNWKVSKPATSSEMGEEKRFCSVCGLEETRSIDKLNNPFVDVQAGKFYETPVLWAVENGVTNGMDATHFKPNDKCTRAQVVTFLWRAAGSPEPTSNNNPFVDVAEGKFYYKAVLWAVEEGITNGVDATHFGTNNECTRGHVATFLWRTLGKPAASSGTNPFDDVAKGKFYYDAVLWAAESGVTTGVSTGKFDPSGTCTRGQIVTFLYRALG